MALLQLLFVIEDAFKEMNAHDTWLSLTSAAELMRVLTAMPYTVPCVRVLRVFTWRLVSQPRTLGVIITVGR